MISATSPDDARVSASSWRSRSTDLVPIADRALPEQPHASDTRGCRCDRAASANPARTAPAAQPPCPSRRRDARPTYRPRRQDRASPRPRRCRRNRRIPGRAMTPCSRSNAASASLTSFCTLMKSRPGTDSTLCQAIKRYRTIAVVQMRAAAGPAYSDAQAAVRRQPLAPLRQPLLIRPQIRNIRRNRRELGPERQRQAQHRTMQIEFGHQARRRCTPAKRPARSPPAPVSGVCTPRITLAPSSATSGA